jgi:hypothetical protein
MVPESLVHLLTPGDLRQVTVACRARVPELGSWDANMVTCLACRRTVPATTTHGSGGPLNEKDWLARVRSLAHTHGWQSYHTLHSQGSEPGWVDLVLLRGSTLKLVELKSQTGRVTPAQRQWLDGLAQVETVQVHLWRPGDLAEVLAVLR